MSFKEFLLDVRIAGGGQEGGQPIQVADDLVGDGAGLDLAGPAHHGRNPEGALPVGVLLVAKGVIAPSGQEFMWGPLSVLYMTMVLSGDAQVIQLLQQFAHALVVVDHDVVVFRLPAPGLAQALGLGMGAEVHVRGVEPHEEGLIGFGLAVDVFRSRGQDLIVDGLHPLFGNWPVSSDAAVGRTAEHAPGAVSFS